MKASYALAAFVLALACGACRSRRSEDLREWRATDHDHTSNPGQSQVAVQADGKSALASYGIDEVTLVAWNRSCATCHGAYGRGDGPQGAMSGARDLTTAEWQDATTDEAITRTIREGRGRMPAFGTLPEPTIESLVRLIRLFDPRRPPPGAASAAPTASSASPPPAHSAPPPTGSVSPRP